MTNYWDFQETDVTFIGLTSDKPLSKERIEEIRMKIHELFPEFQDVDIHDKVSREIVEDNLLDISVESDDGPDWPDEWPDAGE